VWQIRCAIGLEPICNSDCLSIPISCGRRGQSGRGIRGPLGLASPSRTRDDNSSTEPVSVTEDFAAGFSTEEVNRGRTHPAEDEHLYHRHRLSFPVAGRARCPPASARPKVTHALFLPRHALAFPRRSTCRPPYPDQCRLLLRPPRGLHPDPPSLRSPSPRRRVLARAPLDYRRAGGKPGLQSFLLSSVRKPGRANSSSPIIADFIWFVYF
jgi:hypothetical protein